MTATPPALWTWRQGSALPPAPQAQPQQQRSIHALHKPANLTRQLQAGIDPTTSGSERGGLPTGGGCRRLRRQRLGPRHGAGEGDGEAGGARDGDDAGVWDGGVGAGGGGGGGAGGGR